MELVKGTGVPPVETLTVLNVVRTAQALHQELYGKPLHPHDLQVMCLAYRLADACGALESEWYVSAHGQAEL